MNYQTIKVEINQGIASIQLNRSEKNNAFNLVMINELLDCFTDVDRKPEVRVVILTGNGKHFSAGADLNWMQDSINLSNDENLQQAKLMAQMFHQLHCLSKPTIALISGCAYGGAIGLICCCDVAIATNDAKFSLSEVKLGLSPAVIAPYVLATLGFKTAKLWMLTARVFSAQQAENDGLITLISDQLEEAAKKYIKDFITAGPRAISATKDLLTSLHYLDMYKIQSTTTELIATLRSSTEGQAGLNAFFAKQSPPWSLD